FDHYFATYPKAANPLNQPSFTAAPDTPAVNGLTPERIAHNPNLAPPFRLDRAQAHTCDMDHEYTDEQRAYNGGRVDKFVEVSRERKGYTGCKDPNTVMGFYDGNTVTALWNYAQHYAMSDNSYGSVFGPSTPGALNLVAGQTHGVTDFIAGTSASGRDREMNVVEGTVIYDPDPAFDDCSSIKPARIKMQGRTIRDLMKEKNVSWGWFQGGFRPSSHEADGKAICDVTTLAYGGVPLRAYVPHHEPFQYFEQTSNPHHLPPTSTAAIGHDDQANHQYDLDDFWSALKAGNMPAVSFLKAPAAQDGHAGYSDPLDEQMFLVDTVNRLQSAREWKDTAILIAYDDSDGWYDHQMPPRRMGSATKADALDGPGVCGKTSPGAYQGRCGYGPRLPLLVISPYSKANFVDHTITDQTSILRFIEDNWHLGRIGNQSFDEMAGRLDALFDFSHGGSTPPLRLDSFTGEPSAIQSPQGTIQPRAAD
ncbi:MAG TPA: alkaline phosphatase family protein, partial [Candidatus Binataceae bacterium]|nr:alkaline phosphatase family protein [Candidatus Binataceae bacterium]